LPALEDIDRLLAVEKRAIGRASWSKSRETTVTISVPLQISGAIVGGLFLKGTASVHNSPQDGSLLLVYQQQVIERMNVFPTAPHANPLDKRLPQRCRGLTLPALRHRYHPWALNRRWPRPSGDNLPVAEPLDADLANFSEAIKYFMTRIHVSGAVPEPRHEPRLRL
jgi:hypothetical protein